MTHRQCLAWLAWIGDEWDNPSRSDYYAMRTSYEVRLSNQRIKNPNKAKFPKDFRLRFGRRQQQAAAPQQMTEEKAMEWSKAIWLGRMKMAGIKVIEKDAPDQAGSD